MIAYQQLVEELTKDQKREVSSWMRGISQPVRRKISNHAMGEDDTIFLPLEHPDEAQHTPVHPEVAGHLAKHGYRIASGQDYKAGYAVDPHNRQTKIGKALVRTGATADLVNKFNNDPHRALKNNEHLMVAVSRDPHQVAAMSTGRGWSSCMDMDEGINKHYLPEELRAGTHVAYLIHKNDKKIENPIARVALKPYNKQRPPKDERESEYGVREADRENPHTILRPDRTYGEDGGALQHTVSKWTDTHFPMHEGATYRRDARSYDDGGRESIAKPSDHTLKETLKGDKFGVHDLLNMAGSSSYNEHAYHVAKSLHPVATDDHLRMIVTHQNTPKSVVNHYVNHTLDGLEGEHQKNFANYAVDRLFGKAKAMEPHTLGKLLDHADIEHGVEVHNNYLDHSGLEDRHIDRMLKGTTNFGQVAQIPRWKLADHHISALIDPPVESTGSDRRDSVTKVEKMRAIEPQHINAMKGTLGAAHSNLIADKVIGTDADDHEAQKMHGRWLHAMSPEHVPLDKLRGIADHVNHDQHLKNISWRGVITHPDATVDDAKKYHETFAKGLSARPLEMRSTLSEVTNNVKDPETMKALLGNHKQMFQSMGAHKILGDALAKHHADGHTHAAGFIAHPGMDLNPSEEGIKPHHFELAKAMVNHEYVPQNDDNDTTMKRVHSQNRSALAETVANSKSLTKEQHYDFLNTVIHQAKKDGENSPLHDNLQHIISRSVVTTGHLHPDHAEHLNEHYIRALKYEGVLK